MWKHWRTKTSSLYLLWWTIGVFLYGAGTLLESGITLFGWNEYAFKAWYIVGALLGGAPLAQGTVYLLMKRSTADYLTAGLISITAMTALMVILSPINYELVNPDMPSGKVLGWQKIRSITPFINIYALVFLVGGAIYSAYKYYLEEDFRARFQGNILIAIGGTLPAIGGMFSKSGHTEILYVTELQGIILIFIGYYIIKNDKSLSRHKSQFGVGAS